MSTEGMESHYKDPLVEEIIRSLAQHRNEYRRLGTLIKAEAGMLALKSASFPKEEALNKRDNGVAAEDATNPSGSGRIASAQDGNIVA